MTAMKRLSLYDRHIYWTVPKLFALHPSPYLVKSHIISGTERIRNTCTVRTESMRYNSCDESTYSNTERVRVQYSTYWYRIYALQFLR